MILHYCRLKDGLMISVILAQSISRTSWLWQAALKVLSHFTCVYLLRDVVSHNYIHVWF